MTLKCYWIDNDMDTTSIEDYWGEKPSLSAHSWTLKYNETERPNMPNCLCCGYSLPEKYCTNKAYLDPFDEKEYNYLYIESSETYTFIVDKDTSEMVKFEMNLGSGKTRSNVDPALIK